MRSEAEAEAEADAESESAPVESTPAERVEIRRESLEKSFGFDVGTTEEGVHIVSHVASGSPAEGRLQVGDRLVAVNNLDVAKLTNREVAQLCSDKLVLSVEKAHDLVANIALPGARRAAASAGQPQAAPTRAHAHAVRGRSASEPMALHAHGGAPPDSAALPLEVVLKRAGTSEGFGFSVGSTAACEHFVSRVRSNGPADGKLQVFDRIVMCNGIPVHRVPHEEFLRIAAMRASSRVNKLRLAVVRSSEGPPRRASAGAVEGMHAEAGRSPETYAEGPEAGHGRQSREREEGSRRSSSHSMELPEWRDQTGGSSRASKPGSPSREGLGGERLLPRGSYTEEEITLQRAAASGFGFRIAGSEGSAREVFVDSIAAPPALGSALRTGHQILRICGEDGHSVDMTEIAQKDAADALHNAGARVTLVVKFNPAAHLRLAATPSPLFSDSIQRELSVQDYFSGGSPSKAKRAGFFTSIFQSPGRS